MFLWSQIRQISIMQHMLGKACLHATIECKLRCGIQKSGNTSTIRSLPLGSLSSACVAWLITLSKHNRVARCMGRSLGTRHPRVPEAFHARFTFSVRSLLWSALQNTAFFRITRNFWTKIEYSQRASMLIFFDILPELTPWVKGQMSKTSKFAQALKIPRLQNKNYVWNRLTPLNKDQVLSKELNEIFLGNSGKI